MKMPVDMSEAKRLVTQLWGEVERLKADRDLFQHGHRVASDNCVRLEGELALARRLVRKYAVLQGRNRQLRDQLANTRLAPMCERKTGIIERDGYAKTGYVLRKPNADREVCVSDGGAVSWFTLEQWNWLLFNRDHVEFDWPKPLSVRHPHPKPTTDGESPA